MNRMLGENITSQHTKTQKCYEESSDKDTEACLKVHLRGKSKKLTSVLEAKEHALDTHHGNLGRL